MCELMALSFADPVSADVSIREFAARDEANADGWGLGWYPDQSLALVKEPRKWRESRHAGFLESYPGLRSEIYLAHVRHKTRGGPPTRADTHPFAREYGGREYCFAHNGTLDDRVWDRPLDRFRPLGTTDSEHIFCHLLGAIAARGGHLDTEADWRWLHGQLADSNRLGTLNVLLSDGRRLFGYHDAAGWNGMTLREVHLRGHHSRHFEDQTLRLDLEADAGNRGFVIASKPLGGPHWSPYCPGQLLVFERGQLRATFGGDRQAPEGTPTRAAS